MEIVLMYKDNGKDYIVYKQDDKFFGCINRDGEFDYGLNDEEKQILDHIFKELCFNSNTEKIATIEFENELTDIYYDKEKDLYNFKFQSEKELTKEQISILNRLFNDRNNVVYINLKEKDFITRFIKVGKRKILVLLSASMILQTGMTLNVQASFDKTSEVDETEVFNLDDYKKQTIPFKEQINNLKKVQDLKDAIKHNPNLTEEEISYLLSCFSIIEDNIEYINYDYLISMYKDKLDIIYSKEKSENLGEYYPGTGEIKLYNMDGIKEKESVFSHEFSHSTEGGNYEFNLRHLSEAINVIFNNEYIGYMKNKDKYTKYDTTYSEYTPYIYVLLEIIGPEPIRQYHFTQDSQILKDALMEIMPDELNCQSILMGINTADKLIDRNGYLNYLLRELYIAKYGVGIETNPEIMAILNNEDLCDQINLDDYEAITKRIVVKTQKAYFNKKNKYYMKPSTYTLKREVSNYIEKMTVTEALEKGLLKEENGKRTFVNDRAFMIDENTVGYKVSFVLVENDINIYEFINREGQVKTK